MTVSKLLTRRQLASVLSVHMQTITKWEQAGMPIAATAGRGRATHYSESAVRAWKEARDTAPVEADPRDARTRKDLAQARESEQRVALRAKTLILATDAGQVWADEISRCRTKLLGLSRKVKARRPQLTLDDIKEIDRLIREALEDLAK